MFKNDCNDQCVDETEIVNPSNNLNYDDAFIDDEDKTISPLCSVDDLDDHRTRFKGKDYNGVFKTDIESCMMDLNSLTQAVRRNLSYYQARQIVGYTCNKIKDVEKMDKEIRRLIFFIVFYRLNDSLGYNRNSLLKEIRRAAKVDRHRDTIHRYICAAVCEDDLNIIHGQMSVDALVALCRASKDKAVRRKIFDIAMQYLASKKPKAKKYKSKNTIPYPTKSDVLLAFETHKKIVEDAESGKSDMTEKDIIECEILLEKTRRDQKAKDLKAKKGAAKGTVKGDSQPAANTWDTMETIAQDEHDRKNGVATDVWDEDDCPFSIRQKRIDRREECEGLLKSCAITVKMEIVGYLKPTSAKKNLAECIAKRIMAYNDPDVINKIKKGLEQDIAEHDEQSKPRTRRGKA